MAARRSRVDHARLVEDLHTRLDKRLTALATSDDWLDYLAAARRFHRYSPNNQLLLALQGAEGHVASEPNRPRPRSVSAANPRKTSGKRRNNIVAVPTNNTRGESSSNQSNCERVASPPTMLP